MSLSTLFIAGGSASGKTWLADALAERVACTRLSQDRFYHDRPESADGSDRHAFDFDRPEAIDWSGMEAALRDLRSGRATRVPVYDMGTSKRAGSETLQPHGRLLVVDGTLILHAAAMRGLWDHSVFVDAPETLRRERRLRRDVELRQREPADIVRQLETQVFPAHDGFVQPSAARADLVLDAPSLITAPDVGIADVLGLLGRA